MNLNNIKLELNKIKKTQIFYLDITLGDEIIPIRIIKGIEYFIYRDEKGKQEEIILNKKNWFVCVFGHEESNHYCQDEIKHVFSEEGLYKLVNVLTPNKKQFRGFEFALEFALNTYISFLNKKLKHFDINPKIKQVEMKEIVKLIKREELNNL